MTDTEKNRGELLITLLYLIKFTNKDNPARVKDIEEYSKQFGFKYDPENEGTSLNDIRRQRVSECLKYLKDFSSKYSKNYEGENNTNFFPYNICQTPGGKYYCETRNTLNEEQVTLLLSILLNDKYIKDDKIKDLKNAILNAFVGTDADKLNIVNKAKNRKRISSRRTQQNKYGILYRAFLEKGLICAELDDDDGYLDINDGLVKNHKKRVICFVYQIKEVNNIPYVVLLPQNDEGLYFVPMYDLKLIIFSNNELINHVYYDVNLKELYKNNNKGKELPTHGLDVDDYIEKYGIYRTGNIEEIKFYTYRDCFITILELFRQYFGNEIESIPTDWREIEKVENDPLYIPNRIEDGGYVYCKVHADVNAFTVWLTHDTGRFEMVTIGDRINIISPFSIVKELYLLYDKRHYLLNNYIERHKKGDQEK